LIDEVRLSNVARSAPWIKACYDNQKPGSAFLAVGPQQIPTVAGTLFMVQ
jgi:hypothetical protein